VLLWQVEQAITYDGKYSPMTMEHRSNIWMGFDVKHYRHPILYVAIMSQDGDLCFTTKNDRLAVIRKDGWTPWLQYEAELGSCIAGGQEGFSKLKSLC